MARPQSAGSGRAYNQHYACFGCRKMFRKPSPWDLAEPKPPELVAHPCPQCGVPMACMGRDFKAPKQADAEQWAKIALLYQHGYTFESDEGYGPGPRPEQFREVPSFVAAQEQERQDGEREQRLAEAEAERVRKRNKAARQRNTRALAPQNVEES